MNGQMGYLMILGYIFIFILQGSTAKLWTAMYPLSILHVFTCGFRCFLFSQSTFHNGRQIGNPLIDWFLKYRIVFCFSQSNCSRGCTAFSLKGQLVIFQILLATRSLLLLLTFPSIENMEINDRGNVSIKLYLQILQEILIHLI